MSEEQPLNETTKEVSETENKEQESALSRIPNPGSFLVNTGLLFEINRSVLHPLGLTMTFNEAGYMSILEESEPYVGLVFASDEYAREKERFFKFLNEHANERIKNREEVLGYIKQDFPVPTIKLSGCPFIYLKEEGEVISFTVSYTLVERFIEDMQFDGDVVYLLNTYNNDAAKMLYAKAVDTADMIHQEVIDVSKLQQENVSVEQETGN